jgi:hypothetical protein
VDFLDRTNIVLDLPQWLDTLAEHHVIALTGGDTTPPESGASLAAEAPYVWSYAPSTDALFASTGNMVCQQLAGKDATHSTAYASTKRKFAVLIPLQTSTGAPLAGVQTMTNELADCGLGTVTVDTYDPQSSTPSSSESAELASLKASGVTSLIFFPWTEQPEPGAPQHAAQLLNYSPEWITVNWDSTITAGLLFTPAAANAATFGVGVQNRLFPPAQEPWYESYVATGADPSGQGFPGVNGLYHELLILASGIQAAGPHLTAQTFAAALTATQFPNPGADAAPSYQARVGFSAGDVEMQDDFTEYWLNSADSGPAVYTAEEPQDDPWQLYCYVASGARHDDTWPAQDGFYASGGCP